MESSGVSASDVMAMTRNSDGFLEGNGIIILILFFLIFGFGGNGFGGGNSNAVTQAEMQNGLYNQTTDRNLSDIRDAICNTNTNMLNAVSGINSNVLENRYNNALQTQTLTATANTNYSNLSSQLASCCCENRLAIANQTNDLATAIHSEGEATRALMTENRIQELEYQLNQANTAVANAVQTNNILTSIGRFVPYSGYGYVTGCGYNYTGTTI